MVIPKNRNANTSIPNYNKLIEQVDNLKELRCYTTTNTHK